MTTGAGEGAPRSFLVETPTGLPLHVLQWSTVGPPVLLLHGFADNAWIWAEVAPMVAAGRAVAALDLRGHGDSGCDPEGRYGLPTFVDDVLTTIEALGRGPVTLVGHSLGGRAAAYFAARHVDHVAELVLVDAGPELGKEAVTQLLSDVQATLVTFTSRDEYRQQLEVIYPLATTATLDRLAERSLRDDGNGRLVRKLDPCFRAPAFARRATYASRREMWGLLQLIDHPTLVMRGVASAMLSKEVAERMAASLPTAELVTIPRAGHAVLIDNPGGVGQALNAFLVR